MILFFEKVVLLSLPLEGKVAAVGWRMRCRIKIIIYKIQNAVTDGYTSSVLRTASPRGEAFTTISYGDFYVY